jgi:acetyl-CoA carboxylase alpha subunit
MGHGRKYDYIDPAIQAAALSGTIADRWMVLGVSSGRDAGRIQLEFGQQQSDGFRCARSRQLPI